MVHPIHREKTSTPTIKSEMRPDNTDGEEKIDVERSMCLAHMLLPTAQSTTLGDRKHQRRS